MKYEIKYMTGPCKGETTTVRLNSSTLRPGDTCDEEFRFEIVRHAVVGGTNDEARDACFWCGSFVEPYYSRIAPMGYVCPDCGKIED